MSAPPEIEVEKPTFARALGPVEGTSIVVGTVIGSGIFLVPASVALKVGQWGFGTILLVWIGCGLLSLAGALAYAELAAMFPKAGGQYVYLREAYGPLWAFLFGWMEFWVARAGSVAALSVAFAMAFHHLIGYPNPQSGDWSVRWTAFLVVTLLTVINYLGVRWGGTVQVIFTATKVGALGALIVCAFAMPGGSPTNWTPWFSGPGDALSGLPVAIGTAMIAVLWAYDGWANGAAVSEEMKQPQRDVPRALAGGTLIVMTLYVLATMAYHFVLPMKTLTESSLVAASVADKLFLGSVSGTERSLGAGLVSLAVMISTFGACNGTILTGTRIFYAMASDQLFFREMSQLHLRFRTPHWSILFVGLWAGLLILVPFNDLINAVFHTQLNTPLYDQLFTFVIFPSWAFYGMTVAGVLVLRRKRPDLHRPYRALGYPVVPALFALTAAAFVAHTLVHQPFEALGGLFIIALGLPAYAAWNRRRTGT